MKFLKVFGFVLVTLVTRHVNAETPIVEQTDGELYVLALHSGCCFIESINGCSLNPPGNITTTWREQEQRYRSENLANVLATGTTVIRDGDDRQTISNDRHVKIGDTAVIILPSGAREVQVNYVLPLLAQQSLSWTFRRADGTVVTSGGTRAFNVSRQLSATVHIAIPAAMAAGGTMSFEATPDPSDSYPSCPAARDRTTTSVTIPPVTPVAGQSLRGSLLTDALPMYEQKVVTGNSSSVRVSLGSRFTLGVLAGTTLGAPPIASNRERVSSAVTMPLAEKRIFADDAVIAIGGTSALNHEFIAVHLGTSIWRLTPSSGSAVIVTAEVVAPLRLGATENKWDTRIVEIAHKTGILPQFVKGQMAQESPNGKTFDPMGYRYEPCGADLNYVSSNLYPKAGGPKIDSASYLPYRAPNPRGADLQADDLSPRNKYWLGHYTDANRRKLNGADVGITARQIWDGNNIQSVINGVKRGQRWDKLCGAAKLAAILDPNSTILDFVAQTPTAASYGLFQMMFDTAVSEWPGALVAGSRIRAPRYLFDTDENLAIEGGTITIGNRFMAKNFAKTKKSDVLTSYSKFENWALAAYTQYNSFHPTYPSGVITHSNTFLPVTSTGMFQ